MTAPTQGSPLLLPGDQPPLTHLGATLLRHAVDSGLRYAFHNLGLPPPEPVPICIERLRLGLCPRRKIEGVATDHRLAALAGALEDPGGAAPLPATLRGALLFHRARLRLAPRRPDRDGCDGSPVAILRRHLPALRDALLAELAAALHRRHRRSRGAEVGPVQSPESARWLARRPADLTRLGVPDPYRAAWSVDPPAGDTRHGRRDAGLGDPGNGPPSAGAMPRQASAPGHPRAGVAPAAAVSPALPVDPLRGRFREGWRTAANELHPVLHDLGAAAHRRGVVGHPEDPFFLPLQVLDDLQADRAPDWLAASVLANRAEYFGLVRGAGDDVRHAWDLSPLAPLP